MRFFSTIKVACRFMCFAYKVKNIDYIISLWPFPLGRPSCPFIYSIDRRAITPVSDSSSRLKAFRFTWYDDDGSVYEDVKAITIA